MRLFYGFLILIMGMTMWNNAAKAQEAFGIAAIVNDEAITNKEVGERLALAMFASGLAPSEEARQKLLPQIIQVLIDEALYRQDAAKYNYKTEPEELYQAMTALEQRNRLPANTLKPFLEDKGLSFEALKKQLDAQILWSKIVQRRIRPTVVVTDREIEEKMEHISSHTGLSELQLSEIVLPVDEPEHEKQVEQLANKLVQEIQKGADFAAVAREFSRAASAAKGGDIGWMRQDDLLDKLQQKASALRVGQVSEPVRTAEGYYILKLLDRRALIDVKEGDTEVALKQAFVPLQVDSDPGALITSITQTAAGVKGCTAFDGLAKRLRSPIPSDVVMTQLKDLEPAIREAVATVPVGEVAPLVKSSKGIHVLMVCERIVAEPSLAQRDQIRNTTFATKLSLQARRYARNLRRQAFIEIR